jgi:hypothetical protein
MSHLENAYRRWGDNCVGFVVLAAPFAAVLVGLWYVFR